MTEARSSPIGFIDARVRAATLGAALLVAQQVVGKALRDALFLASFGVEWLPYAMIGGAVLSGVVVLGASRAARVRTARRMARESLFASAAILVAAWLVSGSSDRVAALLTYLHSGVLSAASASVFWSLVAETFDPYEARGTLPRVMAGATLGGVVGGLATWQAATMLHAHELLLAAAALNVGCMFAVGGLGRQARPAPAVDAGWRALERGLPYLRSVALLVVCGTLTQAFLDYLLSSAAVAAVGKGPRLLQLFALFQTAVGVLSFALQLTLSRRALQRFGVGPSLAISPALVLAGAVGVAAAPPLLGALVLRGTDGVLGASIHRSAYEVLFAPLDSARRRASKPLLDVGFDRLGMLLGSAIVAVVAGVAPADRARAVLLVGVAVLALVRLVLSPRLQAGYRRTLAQQLQDGTLALRSGDVLDERTVVSLSRAAGGVHRPALLAEVARFRARQARAPADGARVTVAAFDLPVCPDLGAPERSNSAPSTLSPERAEPAPPAADAVLRALAELRSGDAARIRAVLERRRTEPFLAPQVIALLADDGVARQAADWLSAQEPPPVGQLGDALLSDALPGVARRRAARLLGKCDDPRAPAALLAALRVVPTGVRPGVVHALARAAAREPLPREPILDAVRRAALEPPPGDGSRALEEIFGLLAAAYPREPIGAALGAILRGGAARGTALEWLDVLLPPEVKLALWPRLVRGGEHIVATPRGEDDLRRALVADQAGAPRLAASSGSGDSSGPDDDADPR